MNFQEKVIQMKRLYDIGDEGYKDIITTFNGIDKEIAYTFLLNYTTFYGEHEKALEEQVNKRKEEITSTIIPSFRSKKEYQGYFDGACYPKNPCGEMGYGAVIVKDSEIKHEYAGHVNANKHNSNNVAEYLAFMKLLELIEVNKINDIDIMGDSTLVVKQMNREMSISSGRYKPYAIKALSILEKMKDNGLSVNIKWIPREQNTYADMLSKKVSNI